MKQQSSQQKPLERKVSPKKRKAFESQAKASVRQQSILSYYTQSQKPILSQKAASQKAASQKAASQKAASSSQSQRAISKSQRPRQQTKKLGSTQQSSSKESSLNQQVAQDFIEDDQHHEQNINEEEYRLYNSAMIAQKNWDNAAHTFAEMGNEDCYFRSPLNIFVTQAEEMQSQQDFEYIATRRIQLQNPLQLQLDKLIPQAFMQQNDFTHDLNKLPDLSFLRYSKTDPLYQKQIKVVNRYIKKIHGDIRCQLIGTVIKNRNPVSIVTKTLHKLQKNQLIKYFSQVYSNGCFISVYGKDASQFLHKLITHQIKMQPPNQLKKKRKLMLKKDKTRKKQTRNQLVQAEQKTYSRQQLSNNNCRSNQYSHAKDIRTKPYINYSKDDYNEIEFKRINDQDEENLDSEEDEEQQDNVENQLYALKQRLKNQVKKSKQLNYQNVIRIIQEMKSKGLLQDRLMFKETRKILERFDIIIQVQQ